MQLRPYQADSISLTREAFKLHKKVVICLPTGAGKSIIFSQMASGAALGGRNVLILTHRTELKTQAMSYQSRVEAMPGKLEVEMVETFWNRIKSDPELLSRFHFLIIDEAHIGNFKKIVETAPEGLYILGATATPITKPSMSNWYNEIVCPVSISELQKQGYLCRAIVYQSKLISDFTALEFKGEDYTTHSQDVLFNTAKVRGGIIQDFIKNEAWNAKAIVFCASIKSSVELAEQLQSEVLAARVFCVHSKMGKAARNKVFLEYKAAACGVLVNCGIATTGFDCPDINLVVLNRACGSLALYHQMVGRGSRPTESKGGIFRVWDYGQNTVRMGFWDRPLNWRQIFFEPERMRPAGMANNKQCSQCAAFIPSSARKCKYCGFEFAISVKRVLEGELEAMNLQDIKRLAGRRLYSLTVGELAELVAFKAYKKHFFEAVLWHSGKRAELDRYWKEQGYKRGYIARRIDALMNGKFADREVKL
jgi:hypothetical protein